MKQMFCSVIGDLLPELESMPWFSVFDSSVLSIIVELTDSSTEELPHVICLLSYSHRKRKEIVRKTYMTEFNYKQKDLFLKDPTYHPLIKFLYKMKILPISSVVDSDFDLYKYRHVLSINLVSMYKKRYVRRSVVEYIEILNDAPSSIIPYFLQYYLSRDYANIFNVVDHKYMDYVFNVWYLREKYGLLIQMIHDRGLGNDEFNKLYKGKSWSMETVLLT